jgi:hypothetical protein
LPPSTRREIRCGNVFRLAKKRSDGRSD